MRYLLPLCALCLGATSIQAQEPPPLLGQRVWVRWPKTSSGALDKGVKGTLDGVSGDSVSLRLVEGDAPIWVRLDEGSQLFVSTGRRRAPFRGAVIGGGAGALVGLVLGYASGEDCSRGGWFCWDRREMAVMGAVGLGGIGFLGGLIVGGLSHHDTWARVGGPESIRPMIKPVSRGLALGLSLSFP